MVAARAGHRPCRPGPGQDPAAFGLAVEVLVRHREEGLVGALHDALGADVDPGASGHLAVHHQTLFIELVEVLPVGPVGHQVGVGDEHPRRILVGLEHPDRLAGLHQQGLIVLEPGQHLDDLVALGPVAGGAADAAVHHQGLGCSATSGSRLFISIRSGASVSQLLAVSWVPWGTDHAAPDRGGDPGVVQT